MTISLRHMVSYKGSIQKSNHTAASWFLLIPSVDDDVVDFQKKKKTWLKTGATWQLDIGITAGDLHDLENIRPSTKEGFCENTDQRGQKKRHQGMSQILASYNQSFFRKHADLFPHLRCMYPSLASAKATYEVIA